MPAPASRDTYSHAAFIAFNYCERSFPAADRGLGFSFGLGDALRGAGLPCFAPHPAVATTIEDGAAAIVRAFAATVVRRRYLCPLDLADTLPDIRFGNASVRHYSAEELANLFDGTRLARQFAEPVDYRRLAWFQWLVVEDVVPAPARAGQRALPFLYENWSRDLGAIDPHAGNHPAPVAEALFGLLLAPWEDWHRHEPDWRAFLIPWIHVATDDLFARPRPVPSADTLTWEDAAYQDHDGETIEYERPVRLYIDDSAQTVLSGLNAAWWARVTAATQSTLFETPVVHFLVHAAASQGTDQIMAHMTAIEAALGLRSAFSNAGRPRGTRLSPSDRLARRVAVLLNDRQAGTDYAALFEMRSAFVHGRSISGQVSSSDRNIARRLARRVVVALIDAANSPACQPRADYLNALA